MLLEVDIEIREFLIVVAPPPEILRDVKTLKKIYFSKFGNAKYLDSIAHISLFHFDLPLSRQSTLHEELHLYLKDVAPFHVGISGLFSFANNRLLYLKTQKERIVQLQRNLTAILRHRMHIPKRNTPLLSEPHITIALSHTNDQYVRSWNYFRKFEYDKTFEIDKITVLRRNRAGANQGYEIAFEVGLGN